MINKAKGWWNFGPGRGVSEVMLGGASSESEMEDGEIVKNSEVIGLSTEV